MESRNRSKGILFLGRMIYSGRARDIVNNYMRAIGTIGVDSVSIDKVTRMFMGAANGYFWNWDSKNKVFTSDRDLVIVFNEIPSAIEKIKIKGRARLIGSTLFDTSKPEDWVNHMDVVDELWVPTQLQWEQFSRVGINMDYLKIIPYCLDMDFFDTGIAPLKIPGVRQFVFLSVLSDLGTKDLAVLLRSYYQAFKNNQNTTMLIRVTDPSPEVVKHIKGSVKPEFGFDDTDLPHVKILREYVNHERMRQLYNLCDVYVSIGKEKGWDFPAMEATAMGKPVIKEVLKSSVDFLDETNSFLINCTENMVTEERIENMKKELFKAYSNRDLCKSKGFEARNVILKNHSIEAVGKKIKKIINSYGDDMLQDKGKAVIDLSHLWKKWEKDGTDVLSVFRSVSPRPPSPLPIVPDPLITRKDIKRLKALHNKFKGNRIFVMGNGPSMNKTPLHLLKNEYTFGVNRIYLLFDRIDWRPSFYTAFDLRVVPDNKNEINALDIQYKFFATKHRSLLGEDKNKYWYQDNSRKDGLDNRFEPEAVYTGFGGGGSITHLAIQLAFYLGFDPIYLIGVDADYKILPTVKQSGPDKFGDGILLNLESTKDDDPNHFDPRYFGKGKKWHNPNVPEMLRGFLDCRLAIEKRGRRIYNATVGGMLYIFERVDFTSLFK